MKVLTLYYGRFSDIVMIVFVLIEPGYERDMHTERGNQASKTYNDVIEIATVKYGMIDMMLHPPKHFEDIIKIHFTLQRENILKMVTEWGETNVGVKALIPQLTAALDKQSLPDTANTTSTSSSE